MDESFINVSNLTVSSNESSLISLLDLPKLNIFSDDYESFQHASYVEFSGA